ncbi:MAG: membrane protein insertion efficiency factor YidD [Thiohalomonadales bacterium]
MQQIAVFLIKAYRYLISPMLGSHCRYYPTCSSYALMAIQRFGFLRGGYMSIKRLLRCHPWHEGGVDMVPERCTHKE